jgi:hypothetical protein
MARFGNRLAAPQRGRNQILNDMDGPFMLL